MVIIFQLHLSVSNRTDRYLGSLSISIIQDEIEGKGGIMINGLWEMVSVFVVSFSRIVLLSLPFLGVYHMRHNHDNILCSSVTTNVYACCLSGHSIIGTFHDDGS